MAPGSQKNATFVTAIRAHQNFPRTPRMRQTFSTTIPHSPPTFGTFLTDGYICARFVVVDIVPILCSAAGSSGRLLLSTSTTLCSAAAAALLRQKPRASPAKEELRRSDRSSWPPHTCLQPMDALQKGFVLLNVALSCLARRESCADFVRTVVRLY